jgi:flagellar export protein FliJ
MNNTRDPLDIVQKLAAATELEKSQLVAASMRSLSAQERRLAMLEQYLEEYSARATPVTGTADIAALQARGHFLAALRKAVQDQGAEVRRLRVQFEAQVDVWRSAKAKVSAVEQFTGRREARRQIDEARREQAQIDESGRWSHLQR